MRLKLTLALAAAGLLVGLIPAPAHAQVAVPVDAVVTGLAGTRTLTVTEPLITLVGAGTSIGGNFTPVVTEVAYPGDTSTPAFTVQATLTRLLKGVDTIDYTNVTLNPPAQDSMVQLVVGDDHEGTSGAFTGTGATSAARTIFTNDGQVATNFYSGAHTAPSSLSLSLPANAATAAGTYTGTLTVTLVD